MEFDSLTSQTLDFIFYLLPVLLPLAIIVIMVKSFTKYTQEKFLAEQEHILFRIIPPRDVFKTPLAMELFINSLYQTSGESTPIDRLWKGKVRAWFSLEIASHEGEVAFYIWTRKALGNFIQSQIFAQYPGIEVTEVEDYTEKVDYSSGKYEMFGVEYQLTAADPLPIKTYVDYGLDKPGEKEEYKIDPITPTLEFFGSLRQGEHAWLQIIVRAHKKEDKDPKKWFGKTDRWQDEATELIQKIKEGAVYENKKGEIVPLATKGQSDKINAIERSVSKLGFDCGIRAIYIAHKDIFNGINNGALVGTFKQYGSTSLNGFKPLMVTDFDYWWQDISGRKLAYMKNEFYNAYKERGYFFRPFLGYPRKKFILNSEELATIFHFPGREVQTPTLTRVKSTKGNAPADLPI